LARPEVSGIRRPLKSALMTWKTPCARSRKRTNSSVPDPISDVFSETGLIAAITCRERAGNLCCPFNKVSLNVRALDYVHVTMTKLSRVILRLADNCWRQGLLDRSRGRGGPHLADAISAGIVQVSTERGNLFYNSLGTKGSTQISSAHQYFDAFTISTRDYNSDFRKIYGWSWAVA
jgi:hypothetical protein